MDKLNNEIMALEKLLRAKGVASEVKKANGEGPVSGGKLK
jgi:hypothetical protein